MLFFQAIFFHAPHLFWKACEAKLLSRLAGSFKDPLYKVDQQSEQLSLVVKYLIKNRNGHQKYFYNFILCEALNLINVLVQIYLVNEFLGGTFTSYGLDVFNYAKMDQEDRFDPMARVFPKMTKCTFHRFGSSGDVQRHDALCILPLNIINEKIYIVMWFWFVFLASISALWLVFRVATLTKGSVRFNLLNRRASLASDNGIKYVLDRMGSGDWFVLSMMCKNMDSQWFRKLISELCKELSRIQHKQVASRANMVQRLSNTTRKFQAIDTAKERMLDNSDTESNLAEQLGLDHVEVTKDDNDSDSNKQLDSMA